MSRHRRTIAGRPVVITGAASGIGRSLAQRLSRSGSPVAAPAHYFAIIAQAEKRLRSRREALRR